MKNPFRTSTLPPLPASRLDRLVRLFLWMGAVLVIGSWVAPGLVGALARSVGRTFGLMLLFLFLARAVAARIGALFGRSR